MIIIDKETNIVERCKPVSIHDKVIKEDVLQKLLFHEPSILPIGEIYPDFSKLIPIMREFPVKSGYIDVLYATPNGNICLVETKLWRNPEAHRTVVAQIIDYASDLATFSFQEFCEASTKLSGEGAIDSFFNILRRSGISLNNVEFHANIQQSLSTGRFLLLIIGDKIYPQVTLITEAIQSAPHLEFSIALAELRFYESNSGYLVVPNIVGRTNEVTRAVVKIRYEQSKPEIDVTAFEEEAKSTRGKTNRREFLSQMPEGFADIFLPIFEDWEKRGYTISWGTVGFTIRTLHNNRLKTILEIAPYYSSIYSKKFEKSRKLPTEICQRFRTQVRRNLTFRRLLSEDRSYIYNKDLSLEDYSFLLREFDTTIKELTDYYSKI